MLNREFVTTLLYSKALLVSKGKKKKKVASAGIFLDVNFSDQI